jgi:hypothetical protein
MGRPDVDALRRVLGQASGADLIDVLADRLPGADLTSLLLEVMRRRAERASPADVMRQYQADRFVAPAEIGFGALRRAEDAMLAALPDGFEMVTLAPVLPLAAHSAVAAVDPRNVIATIRRTEVAADPTNGLALEAAARRRRLLGTESASSQPVRLAATQRVTRAQRFEGPVSFAHFQLFAAVTAGRDTGSHAFERQHLPEHLALAASGLSGAGATGITIALTRLDEAAGQILAAVRDEFAGLLGVEVRDAPERSSGRAYYRCLCFKVYATFSGAPEPVEIADGGFTDWTGRLLGNAKERLLISGHGLDRVAIMSSAAAQAPAPAPDDQDGSRSL